MDFPSQSLDLKATVLDQTVTSAKKASGMLGTTPQANSAKVEKPESYYCSCFAKIMSAITVLSAKVNSKKSNTNNNCTLCLLQVPGHNLLECHHTKQGLTTPVKCSICCKTGHLWCKHGSENKAKEAYQHVHSLTHAPTDHPKLDSAAMEQVTNDQSHQWSVHSAAHEGQTAHDKNMDQINMEGEVYYSSKLSHTLISASRLVNQGYCIKHSAAAITALHPILEVITPCCQKLVDYKIEESHTTTQPPTAPPVTVPLPVPPAPLHVPDQTQSLLPTIAEQAHSADIESVPTKAYDLGGG
eukprot:208812-Rhodomonas_salina.1